MCVCVCVRVRVRVRVRVYNICIFIYRRRLPGVCDAQFANFPIFFSHFFPFFHFLFIYTGDDFLAYAMLGIDPGTLLFQVLDLLSLPVQQYT
jgi:hypothetical protein